MSFYLLTFERAYQLLKPQLVNTQYTSLAFGERVTGAGIALSMGSEGRAIDNVFTERIWRTLKYEEVYLKSYLDRQGAYRQLNRYIR